MEQRIRAFVGELMPEQAGLPRGGIDARKYAAVFLALGMARGVLIDALAGDLDDAKHILDLTSTQALAKALGCTENDLAIDWEDHLSHDEVERIKGFG